MIVDKKLQEALKNLETQMKVIELSPELKEKCTRVCIELVDFLKQKTTGPLEAYMILQSLIATMEECYGIDGSIFIKGNEEVKA